MSGSVMTRKVLYSARRNVSRERGEGEGSIKQATLIRERRLKIRGRGGVYLREGGFVILCFFQ